MINNDLWRKLEKVGNDDLTVKALLLNLSDNKTRFEFMFYPESISISGDVSNQEKYAMFGSKGYSRYSHTSLAKITIDSLLFTVPRHNRSMIPIEQAIDALRYPPTNKLEPDPLAFVWGKRSIQPLTLTNYSINEIENLNGIPVTLTVDLEFLAKDRLKL